MEPLARLFGTPARLKLLRLFLFNDDMGFTVAEAAFRTKTTPTVARKEVNLLLAADVVRKKSVKGKATISANKRFQHYDALKAFLRDTTDVSDGDIVALFRSAGTIRLIMLSGLFTGAIESKVDILIVADRTDERRLAKAVHALEAELGRELRYACFSSEEFKYRRGVYDRLLRDVFDYPNRVALDKIGVTNAS